MGWSELHARGAAHGVVTYRDADACGVPRATLDGRARRERWERPYPGVFVLPGRVLDAAGRIHAAYRSVRSVTAVGGDAALFLHGLTSTAPSRVDLWVPRGNRATATRTRRVRRSTLLLQRDLTFVGLTPVVRPAWAVHDVAGERTVDALRWLAIDGRFRGLLELDELREVTERDRRVPGRSRLVEVVSQLEHDGSESGFEHRTRARLTAEGWPPDPTQLELATPGGTRRLDLPFSDHRVGVECHGFRYHGDRAQFDADAARWNDVAVLDGWVTLHLTWSMQYGEPWRRFLDRLTSVLTSRGCPRR